MKRFSQILGILCVLSILFAGDSAADVSKAEKNLAREVKRLNDTAAKPDGEKAVVKRIVVDLQTTEPQVRALRDNKLGYGEIAVVLSLAQAMPGGTTDANIQKVLALHQGPPALGWGQVAKQLGTKLDKTVSQVRKTANNANREIKNDHARADKAAKQASPEQQSAPQAPAKQNYQGDGRLLRHGGSAN